MKTMRLMFDDKIEVGKEAPRFLGVEGPAVGKWRQVQSEGHAGGELWALEIQVPVPYSGGDAVDHPEHYNQHPSGIECIDVIEHMGYNIGAVVKYVWRAGLKGKSRVYNGVVPSELEDLKKARWYLDREIERRERE